MFKAQVVVPWSVFMNWGRRLLRSPPVRIAGVYAVLGVAWILFSDRFVGAIARSPAHLAALQTAKGWLFVLASAAVIYLLVRQSTREVRASEGRLRQFSSVTTEGILLLDGGRITDANDGLVALSGRSREDLLAGTVAQLVVDEDWPKVEALLRGGEAQPIDVQLRRADGVVAPTELLMRSVHHHGREIRALAFHDVTKRRLLEHQLRQAQKLEAVALLTSGIAHDFNNLLSVIVANAEVLGRHLEPAPPEVRQDLEDLRRAAMAGAVMIRQLLGFSRQADLAAEPVDLAAAVRDITAIARRLLPDTILVDLRGDGEPLPAVRADLTAVQQILLNLATNARDAMPDGGSMTVALRLVTLDEGSQARPEWVPPGRYVEVSVADTGRGMDQATLARVFEPFFTTKAAGHGTGLGLAMVYGLMKQHGGYTRVTSEPGQGCTATLYFPASADAPRRVMDRQPTAVRGGNETVLLVEDEAPLQRTGRRVLEMLGYRALVAGDGREALDLLGDDRNRVDLVLSDVSMPRMDGPALFRELRRRGNQIPFVFASGHAARQAMPSREEFGALPCIQKPWTVNELAAMLRAALDRANDPSEGSGD
jgi:PAS domain S-box-containing protein